MARILLAWEIGRGQGYARRLRVLADALAGHGHAVALALREPLEELFADRPFTRRPAPFFDRMDPPGASFVPRTFADLMASAGFDDVPALEHLVAGWEALLVELRPDLVVAEYSPSLCLAARGRLPMVQIGTGFTLPPLGEPWFPEVRASGTPRLPQEMLLEVARRVLRRRGRDLASLTDVLATGPRLIHGLPMLDPYRRRRPRDPAERRIGPFLPLPAPAPLPATRRLFAYFDTSAHRTARRLVGALVASGIGGIAYMPGVDADTMGRLAAGGIVAQGQPPPFPDGLRDATWIVHQSGFETAMAALALGRAQFLIPRNLQQFLIARVLLGAGVARGVSAVHAAGQLTAALGDFLAVPDYPARAQAVAAELALQPPRPGAAAVVEACLRLLPGG